MNGNKQRTSGVCATTACQKVAPDSALRRISGRHADGIGP